MDTKDLCFREMENISIKENSSNEHMNSFNNSFPLSDNRQVNIPPATSLRKDVFWGDEYLLPMFEPQQPACQPNTDPSLQELFTHTSHLQQPPLFENAMGGASAVMPPVEQPLVATTSYANSDYAAQRAYGDGMTPLHKCQLLDICEENDLPLRKCKNSGRGCNIETFSTVVNLHEEYCAYPFIRCSQVIGKLNLITCKVEQLSPFCLSYYFRYKVRFLYKQSADRAHVTIVSQGPHKFKYTMVFKDFRNREFLSIENSIGPDTHLIPFWVLNQNGPMVRYTLKLMK